jgi:hypothetical protein
VLIIAITDSYLKGFIDKPSTSGPLISRFTPQNFTEIKLAVAEVAVTDTGKATVDWPDLTSNSVKLEHASIDQKEFAHGNTQRVYIVSPTFYQYFFDTHSLNR